MEIILELPKQRPKLRAAIFDFDGTISTLRHGWEEVMEPFMIEMITGALNSADNKWNKKIIQDVKQYINESTGIQTIFQMQWLADAVKKYGKNPFAPTDPWWYKAEYNRRLIEIVNKRIKEIISGDKKPEDFLIAGSKELLEAFKKNGIENYAASGTDNPDVLNEARILGVDIYFKEIAGAPVGIANCSKEAVLKKLILDYGLKGLEVVVIGDGKVEISLGREAGAITLGVASCEEKLSGINPVKRQRLVNAGAHAIVGDFLEKDKILEWLGLEG